MSLNEYSSPEIVCFRRNENFNACELRTSTSSHVACDDTGMKLEAALQLTELPEQRPNIESAFSMFLFSRETSIDPNFSLQSENKFSFYTEPSANTDSSEETEQDLKLSESDCVIVKNDSTGNTTNSYLRFPNKDVPQDQSMSEFGEKIVKYVCSDDSDSEFLSDSYTDNDSELAATGLSDITPAVSQEKLENESSPIFDVPDALKITQQVSISDSHYMLPAVQSLVPGNSLPPESILVDLRNGSNITSHAFDEINYTDAHFVENGFTDYGSDNEHDLGSKFCIYLESGEEITVQNNEQSLVPFATSIIRHIHQCFASLEKAYCTLKIYDTMKMFMCCSREQLNEMQKYLKAQFPTQLYTDLVRKQTQCVLDNPQSCTGSYIRKKYAYQYHAKNKPTRPRNFFYALGNNRSSKATFDKTSGFLPKARSKTYFTHAYHKSALTSKTKQSHVRSNRKFSEHMFPGIVANPPTESFCDLEIPRDDGMIPTVVSLRHEHSISSVSYSNMCIPPVPTSDVLSGEDVDTLAKKYLKSGTHFAPGKKSPHKLRYACANRAGHTVGHSKLQGNYATVAGRNRRDFAWREAQAKAEEKVKFSIPSVDRDEDRTLVANSRGDGVVKGYMDEYKENRSITKRNLKSAEAPKAARGRQQRCPSPRHLSKNLENGGGDGPETPSNNWLVQKNGCSTKRDKNRGINQEAMEKLESILATIWNMEESGFIITYEVSKEEPTHKFTSSMNLMTIASKLRRRIYETVEQMVHDFRRILYDVRFHYEGGQEKDVFYSHTIAIGKKFDKLLQENFNGCDYPKITGDPIELKTNSMLHYSVWDDSE